MKTQIFNIAAVTLFALSMLFASGAAQAQANNDTVDLIFGDSSSSDSAKPKVGFLVISAGAYHFRNFDERNAFTPGIGWEYSPSNKIGWHVGTVSDSFGFQATYGGINYATRPVLAGKVRFILGATVLHKQFSINSGPETRIVPLPALEFKMSKRAVLNLSGSPQIDFANQRNNGVLFVQFKLRLR